MTPRATKARPRTKARATKARASKPTTTRARAKARSGTSLVIVESPAKARTIARYLGPGYTVKASVGHVRDLPKRTLGVDVANRFEPEYVVIRDKKQVIADIRKAASAADQVFLAADPDREGEAIAWHIAEEIADVNANIKRVLFNEITRKAITEALRHPTVVDVDKTNAQQARRILDRLVGYEISPLLWNKVKRGLSAGRVQSVAVRLLCEREAEILAFEPVEYWSVECRCKAAKPPPFAAKIWRWDGAKAAPRTESEARVIAAELEAGPASVVHIDKKQRSRKPQPPFITSKLQQEAARKLRFDAKRTMRAAQKLYEGVDLGDDGPVGLITYMRTDSTRVSDDAIVAVRQHIADTYGAAYLPSAPVRYSSKHKTQDGHEAIRPTSMAHTPDEVAAALGKSTGAADLIKLYRLIWQRFVASQMKPALYDQTAVDIERGRAILRATGQILRFPGFTAVYTEQETDDPRAEAADAADKVLPPLAVGDPVELVGVETAQHFTQPPPRFTEATLVKELEEKGIGRPSTYATILSTIVARGYAERRSGRFHPTELGTLVNGLLVESFPEVLDVHFTAQMEAALDKVEVGERDWRELLASFYEPFSANLVRARAEMRDVRPRDTSTGYVCERCSSPMAIRQGRKGPFLSCTGYPDCRNTKEVVHKPDGSYEVVPEPVTDEVCDDCGAPMRVRKGRYGEFLACTRYPACKATRAMAGAGR